MPNENKDSKPTDIVEVEVKGKKFKVTKAFKDELDGAHKELTTKVATLEADKGTLAQRLEDMEKNPTVHKKGGGTDDDDDGLTFDQIIDNPDGAVSKAVLKTLKKLGIDPSKIGDTSNVDQKVQVILQQDKYWAAFYKEHGYFDEDVHGELIKIKTRQLLPKIKDLGLKEGRAAIAEAVADMLGRKITKGKLEIDTEPKHKAQNGMQLEGADGGDVDNHEISNDTDANKGKTGSMADDLRKLKANRLKAAKGK